MSANKGYTHLVQPNHRRLSKRLKDAVIATRVFAPDPGAAANRLMVAAQALATAAERVTVLTTNPLHDGPVTLPDNVAIKRTRVLRDRDGAVRGYIPYLSFDLPLFFRLLFQPHLGVVLCEPPPTTGIAVKWACALRRTPYVYYACDILSDAAQASQLHPRITAAIRFLEKTVMAGAAEVIAVTPHVANRVAAISQRTARIVPHAVEPIPEALPLPQDWPEGGPVFLYAGTVTEWMGADAFLAASTAVIEEFPDARIVFLGQGMGWDKLRAQVRERGYQHVICIPAVSAKEAAPWYAHATATLASLRPEGYSGAYTTKVLTSLAAGTPVVYAGVGPAAHDIATNDLGAVVDFDTDEIAQAMVSVAKDVQSGSAQYSPSRLKEWVNTHYGVASAQEKLIAAIERASHKSS